MIPISEFLGLGSRTTRSHELNGALRPGLGRRHYAICSLRICSSQFNEIFTELYPHVGKASHCSEK